METNETNESETESRGLSTDESNRDDWKATFEDDEDDDVVVEDVDVVIGDNDAIGVSENEESKLCDNEEVLYKHRAILSAKAVFQNIHDAKMAIKHFCTTKRSPVFVKYSRPKQFAMKCQSENCPFKIACNQMGNGRVYMTHFGENHECFAMLEGRPATVPTDYVVHRISQTIHVDVSTLQASASREEGVVVPYTTAYRAKRKALKAFREEEGLESCPSLQNSSGSHARNKGRV